MSLSKTKKVSAIILILLIVPVVFQKFLKPYLYAGISYAGVVLDIKTNEPIAEAIVTFECHVGRYHGTKKISETNVVSDKDGRFVFWYRDLHGCIQSNWHHEARKEGYKRFRKFLTNDPEGRKEPILKKIYLIKNSDARIDKLKEMGPSDNLVLKPDGSIAYAYEYNINYQKFIKAKLFADNKSEQNWVRESYCDRLYMLYTNLTENELVSLNLLSTPYRLNGQTSIRQHDFDSEVKLFCEQD